MVLGILMCLLVTMLGLDLWLFVEYLVFKSSLHDNDVLVCRMMDNDELDPILSGPYTELCLLYPVDKECHWWMVQYKGGQQGMISVRTLYVDGWKHVRTECRGGEK